jgi:hypothetical protein
VVVVAAAVVVDVAAVAVAAEVAAAAFPEAVAVRGPVEEIFPVVVGAVLLVREVIVVDLPRGVFLTPDEVTAVSLLRGTPVPATEPRVSV